MMTDEERQLITQVHDGLAACLMRDEPPTIGDVVAWAHTLTDALAADRPKLLVPAHALSADRINPQRVWREKGAPLVMIDERIKAKLEEMRAQNQQEVDWWDKKIAERAAIFARPMKDWTIECLVDSDFIDKHGFDPRLMNRQAPADEVAAIDRALEALPRDYDGFRAEMIMHDGCQWISVGDPMIKRAAEKVCLDLYERGEDPMKIGYQLMQQEWFRPKHSRKGHEIRTQLEAGKSYDELMRRYDMSPAEFFNFINDGQGETWSGRNS